MNKTLRTYHIAIQALEEKRYTYDFSGDTQFFTSFEQDIIQKGTFDAHIILDKTATMIRVQFQIKGSIELICDRSLEPFTEEVYVEEPYVFKFGETADIIGDGIEIIPFGTPEINVAQHILDFLILSVPMKRIHPDLREEDEEDDEDVTAFLVYSDASDEEEEEEEDTETEEGKEEETPQEVDPRWAALLKLKNLN